MTGLTCDNCGEEIISFDPLYHPEWCVACRNKAFEISLKARDELEEFGSIRREEREMNESNNSKRDSK